MFVPYLLFSTAFDHFFDCPCAAFNSSRVSYCFQKFDGDTIMCYNTMLYAEPNWPGFFMTLAKFGKWNRLR